MIWLDEGGRQRDVHLTALPTSLRRVVEHLWVRGALPPNPWRPKVPWLALCLLIVPLAAGAQTTPDVAYVLYSPDPGARLIEVVSFPDARKKWTISKPGASRLRWSRDGTELFYVAGEARMKVSVSTNGKDLAPGQPEPLFPWRGLAAGSWDSASFDVSRDGRRFLVIEPLTNEEMPTFHVVLNPGSRS
jgi:hypothetical protein